MERPGGEKLLLAAAVTVSVAGWATGNITSRIAITYFSAECLTLLRFLFSAILIDLIALMPYGRVRRLSLREVPLFLGLGVLGFSGYIMLFNFGIRTVPAATASFILAASPIPTAIIAIFLLKEKMTLRGWLATALSLVGMWLILMEGKGLSISAGAGVIAFSTLMLSLYNTLIRRLAGRYSAMEITLYSINAAAVTLLPFLPQLLRSLPGAPPECLLAAAWLGTVTSVIAFLSWAYVMQKAGNINRVSNAMFITPLLTVGLAYIMLDEVIHAGVWYGGALVLAGVALMNWRQGQAIKPDSP